MSSNLQSFLPGYIIPSQPLRWSIFLALLVHIAGAIGIAFYNRDFFISYTAGNLLVMFVLLIWNEAELNFVLVKAFVFAFLTGLITEIIGVNTGLLFGSYHYGEVFGEKLMGVPFLIGLNWFCIVYAAFQVVIMSKWVKRLNTVGLAVLTAGLATIFDWIMEPVAIDLGFWKWHSTEIPFLNYACWFSISFIVALFFYKIGVRKTNPFAIYLFCTQLLFFVFLGLVKS